jgi:hypothetical protein
VDVGRLAPRKKFSNWIASLEKNVNVKVIDNVNFSTVEATSLHCFKAEPK